MTRAWNRDKLGQIGQTEKEKNSSTRKRSGFGFGMECRNYGQLSRGNGDWCEFYFESDSGRLRRCRRAIHVLCCWVLSICPLPVSCLTFIYHFTWMGFFHFSVFLLRWVFICSISCLIMVLVVKFLGDNCSNSTVFSLYMYNFVWDLHACLQFVWWMLIWLNSLFAEQLILCTNGVSRLIHDDYTGFNWCWKLYGIGFLGSQLRWWKYLIANLCHVGEGLDWSLNWKEIESRG